MSVLDTLITDRTLTDVENVKAAYRRGEEIDSKGQYRYTDLNRVETAVEYMAAAFVQAQADLEDYAESVGVQWDHYYDMPYDTTVFENIVIKKNWAEGDRPSASQMNRYHGNLVLVRNALPTAAPLPESMNGLDYEGANQIEQMLLMANEDLARTVELKKSFINSSADAYRSGEIYSGEGDA